MPHRYEDSEPGVSSHCVVDFPFLSSKSSEWLHEVREWRSVAWVCKLSQQQGLILRHGVTIAPTMQRHQQPVSQDLLAWIFWEFQHVDTVEKGKKTRSAVAVMTTHGAGRVGMTPRCPQEKELLRYEVPVAHSSRKRTLPVFKLPSAYKDSPTQSQRY